MDKFCTIVVNIPPMPMPKDFGLNLEENIDYNIYNNTHAKKSHELRLELYRNALAAWERVVVQANSGIASKVSTP